MICDFRIKIIRRKFFHRIAEQIFHYFRGSFNYDTGIKLFLLHGAIIISEITVTSIVKIMVSAFNTQKLFAQLDKQRILPTILPNRNTPNRP